MCICLVSLIFDKSPQVQRVPLGMLQYLIKVTKTYHINRTISAISHDELLTCTQLFHRLFAARKSLRPPADDGLNC